MYIYIIVLAIINLITLRSLRRRSSFFMIDGAFFGNNNLFESYYPRTSIRSKCAAIIFQSGMWVWLQI
jgi:hypothetical protein